MRAGRNQVPRKESMYGVQINVKALAMKGYNPLESGKINEHIVGTRIILLISNLKNIGSGSYAVSRRKRKGEVMMYAAQEPGKQEDSGN